MSSAKKKKQKQRSLRSLENDERFLFSFFQQWRCCHSSLAVCCTCVATGVLSADHIGLWAVTAQFTNGGRCSKKASYIQDLLRNALSGHTLSICPGLMS